MLVDGHNIAYRAFHAIPPLTAPDGTPIQAVLGFGRILASLRDIWRPSHVCVAFDGGLPAARTEALAAYKAQRAPMPDTLRPQFAILAEYLSLACVAHIRVEGEEADDILATLARRAAGAGADVVVVSGDKDLLQLASDRIALVRPQATRERVDPAAVHALLGIDPDRVPEWLALTGDSSDNIPGVPGIGAKTATALLSRFGTLNDLWARVAEVTPARIRDLLLEHRATVDRNLGMVRLRDDLLGLPDWTTLALGTPRGGELRSFLARYGLRSLMSLVPEPELF